MQIFLCKFHCAVLGSKGNFKGLAEAMGEEWVPEDRRPWAERKTTGPEEKKRLDAWEANGRNNKLTARQLKMSNEAFSAWLRRRGFKRWRNRLSPNEDARRLEAYWAGVEAGIKEAEIAKGLGIARGTFSAWRIKRGLASSCGHRTMSTKEVRARLNRWVVGGTDDQIATDLGMERMAYAAWRRGLKLPPAKRLTPEARIEVGQQIVRRLDAKETEARLARIAARGAQ